MTTALSAGAGASADARCAQMAKSLGGQASVSRRVFPGRCACALPSAVRGPAAISSAPRVLARPLSARRGRAVRGIRSAVLRRRARARGRRSRATGFASVPVVVPFVGELPGRGGVPGWSSATDAPGEAAMWEMLVTDNAVDVRTSVDAFARPCAPVETVCRPRGPSERLAADGSCARGREAGPDRPPARRPPTSGGLRACVRIRDLRRLVPESLMARPLTRQGSSARLSRSISGSRSLAPRPSRPPWGRPPPPEWRTSSGRGARAP